jgi:hypothetical protein
MLPVDRNLHITDELLDAARHGDLALVAMLLADEETLRPDELECLETARREDDGSRFSLDEACAELGIVD